MAPARKAWVWSAAALLLASSTCAKAQVQTQVQAQAQGQAQGQGQVEPAQVNTIRDVFARFKTCWKPPPLARANPIDITVIVSFNRSGEILGHPRITYESGEATDNDRLAYRVAVMEALQRCTPMPFTESMAGAIAGRPFAVQFHNRKSPPQAIEKRAWLTPKIL